MVQEEQDLAQEEQEVTQEVAQVAQVPGLEEAQAILTGLQAALKGKQVTSVAQLFLPNRPGDMKIARAAGKLDHLPPLLLPRAPTL